MSDLEPRVEVLETITAKHERLLFGHYDEETDKYVDGVVQKVGDMIRSFAATTKIMVLAVRIALPSLIAIVLFEALLVVRAFGPQAVWDFWKTFKP